MRTGEYIQKLLKSKRISIRKLAGELNIGSRNELYRLFNGYHSYEKQKQLIEAIAQKVNFTDKEISEINNLLEKYKDGEFAYEARRILMNIFTSEPRGYSTKHRSSTKKLAEILQGRSGKKVIIMHGIQDERIIQDVHDYLETHPYQTLCHYVRFASEDTLTAYEILALLKLSVFSGYKPMQIDFNMPNGLAILGKTASGTGYLQFIEFSDDEPKIVETSISDTLFEYFTQKNNKLRQNSKPLFKPAQSIPDCMNILTAEPNGGGIFTCTGAPCCGYPNIPQECPADTAHKHWDNLLTAGNCEILFDNRHIDEFLQNEYSVEQSSRYIKELIDLSLSHPENIRFRMLADEYTIEYPFVYAKNSTLCIYRAGTGDTDGSAIIVDDAAAVCAMKYFTQHLWEQFTVSQEQTVSLLEEKISEYTGQSRR